MPTKTPMIMIETDRLPRPLGHTPLRREQSVRRTAHLDMTWPQGRDHPMQFDGVARDIFSATAKSEPEIISQDTLTATITSERVIKFIKATPPRDNIQTLIGEQGGGHLRAALTKKLPEEASNGSPLYLLIDDLSGTSLIAGWAWTHWSNKTPDPKQDMKKISAIKSKMEGVCIGFKKGSSALLPTTQAHNTAAVVPLENPNDLTGWHALKQHTNISMRRARRIDVWLDTDIHIEAMFQDSASVPEGGRVAIHEYSLKLRADANSHVITHIEATPHILPFPECPSAINNINKLKGVVLPELRDAVLNKLRKTDGCTHLNDALRSLAEVPTLLSSLQARL